MKRFAVLILLMGALLAAPLFAQEKSAPAPAAPPAAVAADDYFRVLVEDQRVLAAAIELSENAKGKLELRYSLAELRAVLDARQKATAAWLRTRGVGAMCPGERIAGETCWRFNVAKNQFEPPPASSSSPSVEGAKPEVKPKP